MTCRISSIDGVLYYKQYDTPPYYKQYDTPPYYKQYNIEACCVILTAGPFPAWARSFFRFFEE